METTERGRLSFVGMLFRAAHYPHCLRVIAVWFPVATVIVGYALVSGALGVAEIAALFVLGWVGWTLLEYVLHRFVQHWEPPTAKLLRWRETILPHNSHHDRPENPRNAVTRKQGFPVLLWLAWFGIGYTFLPPIVALTFLAGSGAGYAVYELIHFSCHHGEMSGRLPRRLKQHHLLHHYRDETVNFGVTTTIWDRVFRTLYIPGKKSSEPQATA